MSKFCNEDFCFFNQRFASFATMMQTVTDFRNSGGWNDNTNQAFLYLNDFQWERKRKRDESILYDYYLRVSFVKYKEMFVVLWHKTRLNWLWRASQLCTVRDSKSFAKVRESVYKVDKRFLLRSRTSHLGMANWSGIAGRGTGARAVKKGQGTGARWEKGKSGWRDRTSTRYF